MAIPRSKLITPSPEVFPVKTFVSPRRDVVFYVLRDSRVPANKSFTYGATFKSNPGGVVDPALADYLLCHVAPADESGWQKWYYAASRDAQDTYNYEERDGQELLRTYVVPRGYRPAIPDGGDPDAAFSQYKFAGVSIKSPGEPLEGLFEVVYHRFVQSPVVEKSYNDSLDAIITTTKEVIKKGSGAASSTAGTIVEIKDGGVYHDVRITSALADTADRTLETIPSFADYNFPTRLDSVGIVSAWAWADSDQAAYSYDEDFYFEFKTTEPKPGPYPAKIYRTITATPETLMAALSLAGVPVPRRETIGVTSSWFHASPEGNRTYAMAREFVVPASVHTALTIKFTRTEGGPAEDFEVTPEATLDATPGFTGDFAGEIPVAADVRPLPLGMYEVRVTKLSITGGVYA